MNEEIPHLRGLLAKPEDSARRTDYAEWLEKRNDPRAALLRMDPSLQRLSYVAWLETDGHLDFYIEEFPEVKREAEARKSSQSLRDKRSALSSKLDPDWVPLVNTLGCPFEEFFFFDNHGAPRECTADELPFSEPLGSRGAIITFKSDFRDEASWEPGLMRDLRFLSELKIGNCAYGAATCPLHPLICSIKPKRTGFTGADILAALKPKAFHSHFIRTVDATSIPYPGYHPPLNGPGGNDEIHNDYAHQYLFENKDEKTKKPIDEFKGVHGELKKSVVDSHLWYVLLHTVALPRFNNFSRYAILLAVGKSQHGDRLIGVITHQVCHNLCD